MDLQAIGEAASRSAEAGHVVKQRVLQADADFWCYKAANVDYPLAGNIDTLHMIVRDRKKAACAEHVLCHITLGLKSGRDQIATVKTYQEQRSDRAPELKERVRELREYIANYRGNEFQPVADLQQEADDTLTQYQLRRMETHGVDKSIIESGDKDLWMVPGLHINPDTDRIYCVRGYGKTEYREVGNVKPKLVGEGTSWFWHQMQMGDKADNIPGLPMLGTYMLEEFMPLKNPNPNRKPKLCGEKAAVAVLTGCTDDVNACSRVYGAYQEHYGPKAMEMFVEQAYLLWMRRTNSVMDVIKWLRTETGFDDVHFSEAQKERLRQFGELVARHKALAKVASTGRIKP